MRSVCSVDRRYSLLGAVKRDRYHGRHVTLGCTESMDGYGEILVSKVGHE